MLCSLKTKKASGLDGIPPRFLKEFFDELAPVLCHLFHFILNSCTYPSWKQALVQPVPNKGVILTPPTITLLPSFQLLLRFSKLCLTPTSSNISNVTIFFQITSMASYLTHTWSSSPRNFGESFVVTLDIVKAFDRVWHKALLVKRLITALLLPSVNSFLAF